MVMERRGERSTHPTTNGRHVKQRRKMSYKTLYRLTITMWMISSFTAGAITEFLINRIS